MASALDAGSVAVPFESLKRVTRERKYFIEEVEGVIKGVQTAAAAAGGGGDAGGGADAAQAHLEQYVVQLQGLKRKVGGQGCRIDSAALLTL